MSKERGEEGWRERKSLEELMLVVRLEEEVEGEEEEEEDLDWADFTELLFTSSKSEMTMSLTHNSHALTEREGPCV